MPWLSEEEIANFDLRYSEESRAQNAAGDPNSHQDTSANRRAWAKAGYAMSDGSFPVLKCGSGFGGVRSAISSIGRGDASYERVKAHIIKNAKRLGCSADLPDDWKGAA